MAGFHVCDGHAPVTAWGGRGTKSEKLVLAGNSLQRTGRTLLIVREGCTRTLSGVSLVYLPGGGS